MANELRDAVTTQLGPFPAWVWGLLLGGGIVTYRFVRDRVEEGEPEADGEAQFDEFGNEIVTGTASGFGDFTLTPSTFGGGTFAVAPAPVPREAEPVDEVDTEAIETNQQWAQQARAWLAGPGGFTGVIANDSITKWLDGSAVSATEVRAINAAISEFGPPPQGAPPIRRIPTEPSVTPPAPQAKQPPAAVRNLRTGNVTREAVFVGWAPPAQTGGAPVVGYQVQYENAGIPGRWRTVGGPVRGGLTSRDTFARVPVDPGWKVRVRVRARNSVGWSSWATTRFVQVPSPARPTPAPTPRPAPRPAPSPRRPSPAPTPPRTRPTRRPPGPPRRFRVMNRGRNAITVRWTEPRSKGTPAQITGYQVQWGFPAGFRGGMPRSTPTQWRSDVPVRRVRGGGTATRSGLAPGVRADFRVRARNAAGWGPWSSRIVTSTSGQFGS